ncbi:hypothetical protein FACS1894158_11620 [Betaproteobacteria bacterium]|nr:hypothetical protein FACS1894158_11620 [Betaproteobacteria bacterium]
MTHDKPLFVGNKPHVDCFEEIGDLIYQVKTSIRMSLPEHTREVDAIIRNRVTDENRIERLLDTLIDLAGMDEAHLVLFKRLCRYYLPLNPRAVGDYVGIYRELYDEEKSGGDEE